MCCEVWNGRLFLLTNVLSFLLHALAGKSSWHPQVSVFFLLLFVFKCVCPPVRPCWCLLSIIRCRYREWSAIVYSISTINSNLYFGLWSNCFNNCKNSCWNKYLDCGCLAMIIIFHLSFLQYCVLQVCGGCSSSTVSLVILFCGSIMKCIIKQTLNLFHLHFCFRHFFLFFFNQFVRLLLSSVS